MTVVVVGVFSLAMTDNDDTAAVERELLLVVALREAHERLDRMDAALAAHVARHEQANELAKQGVKVLTETPYFVCPFCSTKSYCPGDVAENYCGNCHRYVDELRSFCL